MSYRRRSAAQCSHKRTSSRATHHLRGAATISAGSGRRAQATRMRASCKMHNEAFCVRSDLAVPLPQDAGREGVIREVSRGSASARSRRHVPLDLIHLRWCAATACRSGESDGRVARKMRKRNLQCRCLGPRCRSQHGSESA